MRYLVTGGCGSIGSALVEYLLGQGNTVCSFDNSEEKLFNQITHLSPLYASSYKPFLGDVRDYPRLKRAFNNVDYVFHCAALKHVAISEYNPFEALKTNVEGTHNVVEACLNTNVQKLVFASSDKAVNPSSTMGASKLLAERITTSSISYSGSSHFKACCVRFGNVWNTAGSVGPIFKRQSLNKLPLTVTSPNMTRFFITIDAAIDLCRYAMSNMHGGEIYVANMGALNIYQLATSFNSHYNNNSSVNIIGPKPGEKEFEELFTETEAKRASYNDGYYVIPSETQSYADPNFALTSLRSDDLSLDQIDHSYLISLL